MDIAAIPNKRKHTTKRSPSPPSKRHRHSSPEGPRFGEEEDQDEVDFLNRPGAKKELVNELGLLSISTAFESATDDAEAYLPVCSAHEHIQHILDTYEGDDSGDDVKDGRHGDHLKHPSVPSLDHASQVKETQQQQEQHPLPTQQTASDAPIQPTASIREKSVLRQAVAPPWKQSVPYKPLFWPVSDLHKTVAFKKPSASEDYPHEGDEHLNILDLSENLKLGTLWTRLRENLMADLLIDHRFVPRSHQVERDDFLKACIRLRHMVHPNRLSVLLGTSSRPPQYCEFLLNAMLGFYNVPDIRRKIDPRSRFFKTHVHIDVYHDALYPDNDPIIKRLDRLQKRDESAKGSDHERLAVSGQCGDSYQDELILLSDDPIDRESDQEENETPKFVSQLLQYADSVVEEFAEYASYVLRSYMHSISGETFYNVNDFAKHCQQLGIPFLDAQRSDVNHDDGDLKWINEPILAATIGKRSTIKEPLQLWKHAVDNFSEQNLARCALIRTNSLLDWLEYVVILKNPKRRIEDHFMYERPVVCLAPVALLHLSDIAANFALDVLRTAVRIAETEQDCQAAEKNENVAEGANGIRVQDSEGRNEHLKPDNDDNEDEDLVIEIGDIHKAARSKLRNTACEGAVAMHILSDDVKHDSNKFIDFLRTESQWPRRKIRPYTSAETFKLCSRFPVAVVSIPHSAICEKRAIVMGMTYLRHNDVYTPGAGAFWPRRRLPALRRRLELSEVPYIGAQGSRVEGAVTGGNQDRGVSDPSTNVANGLTSRGKEDPSTAIQANCTVNSEKIVGARPTPSSDNNNDNETTPQGGVTGNVQTQVTGEGDSQQQRSAKFAALHEKGAAENTGSCPGQDIQGSTAAYHSDLAKRRWNTMKKKYTEFFNDTNEAKKLRAQYANKSVQPKDLHAAAVSRSKTDSESEEEVDTDIGDDDYLRHSSSSLCYNRFHWIVLHALGINIGQRTSVHRPLTYASAANYTNFRHFTSTKALSIDREALYELASLTELIVRDEAEILMECAIQDDGRPWIDRADVALVHAVRKKEFPYTHV